MQTDGKMVILHVLYATNSKTSGVRTIVPKHLEHQSKYANVALLNCNDSEVEEAGNIYKVFKLNNLKDENITNLPQPFNKPDIVIFHAIYYYQYIKIYKQCIKNNIPYIVIPHGSLTKKAQQQKIIKKIPANILFFNKYLKNAKCIQFLTEGEMKASRKTKEYIIDGNGIEISDVKKEFTESNNNEFKIIYIGRYDTYTKGLDLLIKAVKSIDSFCKENNIKILLYGNDYKNRKRQIENLIKKDDVANIVSLNGPIFNQEKREELLKSDVFIQVSRTEGQPVGLMEAIDLGIPCIVTRQTNFGDEIINNKMGWVVQTDKDDIAAKIMEAYNSRTELKAISEREKEYSANNFDWDKISKKTIEDYRKIIEK